MPIPEVMQTDTAQLRDIADTIAVAKRVVVITGAGISTSCGIPDFRSQDGLYNLFQTSPSTTTVSSSPPIKGKDLFSSQLWNSSLTIAAFYKFIASLRRSIHHDVKSVSSTHRFLRTLRDRRKLVRVYTQNIDGLEARAGLVSDLSKGKGSRSRFCRKAVVDPPVELLPSSIDGGNGCEVVPLHGTLTHLRCTQCSTIIPWKATSTSLFSQGLAPPCPSCSTTSSIRSALGKRSCSTKVGSLRPDIVLYGEEHTPAQADAIGDITQWDLGSKPDLLLILGTSLHVHGLKVLVREFAKAVKASRESNNSKKGVGRPKVVYVNLGRPSESVWSGIIDTWVNIPCDEWMEAMRRMRPDIWEVQTRLSGKVLKPLSTCRGPKVNAKVPDRLVIGDSEEEEEEEEEGEEDEDKENSPLKTSVISVLRKQQQETTPRKLRPVVSVPSPPSSIARSRIRSSSELKENTLPATPSKGLQSQPLLPTPPSTIARGRKRLLSEMQENALSISPRQPHIPLPTPPASSSSNHKRKRPYLENNNLATEADDLLPSTPTKKPRRGRPPGSMTKRRPMEVDIFQD